MANDLISPALVMEPPYKPQMEGFRELPDGELGGAGRVAPREAVGVRTPSSHLPGASLPPGCSSVMSFMINQ